MTYPPGVPDPGSDFRCQRCGFWVYSSATVCHCAAGPLRKAGCVECGAVDCELDPDGFCKNCYDRFDLKSIDEQDQLDHGEVAF
jgi:hypothetical protein